MTETDRQAGRQTDRQTKRKIDRQNERIRYKYSFTTHSSSNSHVPLMFQGSDVSHGIQSLSRTPAGGERKEAAGGGGAEEGKRGRKEEA